MARFASILCAVDGSRRSAVAVRRAIALADGDTEILFLAVARRVGAGPTLPPARAEEALRDAAAAATTAGVRCTCVLEHAPDRALAILEYARDHELLVLGAPAVSRATGILAGSLPSTAAHRAPGPVLLARGDDDDGPFPRHIIAAADGSDAARTAVATAAELAARAGARVTLAHVGGHDDSAALPAAIAEQAGFLRERLGVEPDIEAVSGRAAHALAALASRGDADLLVLGSRGLHGARALGSTSERVAHDAPISVLIMRPVPIVPAPRELAAAAHDDAVRARDQVVARRVASGRLA
jgi:nucleotide-binding universal stress UspA family protein